MNYLLPLIYAAAFLLLILKSGLFKDSVTSGKEFAALFVIKLMAGFGYAFLYKHYYGGINVDIYNYFNDSLPIYNSFFKNPFHFFELIGRATGSGAPDHLAPYLAGTDYASKMGDYTLIRINALLRFISGGHFFVHVVIFNILAFTGFYKLYQLFIKYFPHKKQVILFSLFLFPSVLFWTSGVHKEALFIFCTGLLLYYTDQAARSFPLKTLPAIVFPLMLLFFTRHYMAFILLPLLTAYFISLRFTIKSYIIFPAVLLGSFLILMLLLPILPVKPLELISNKRLAFEQLEQGEGTLLMQHTPPTPAGLLQSLPEAVNHTLLRPYPTEAHSLLQYALIIENYLFLLLCVSSIVIGNFKKHLNSPLLVFSFLFGITLLLLIGLVVNNTGAIVRYKSQALPFLLIFFTLSLEGRSRFGLSVPNQFKFQKKC